MWEEYYLTDSDNHKIYIKENCAIFASPKGIRYSRYNNKKEMIDDLVRTLMILELFHDFLI